MRNIKLKVFEKNWRGCSEGGSQWKHSNIQINEINNPTKNVYSLIVKKMISIFTFLHFVEIIATISLSLYYLGKMEGI